MQINKKYFLRIVIYSIFASLTVISCSAGKSESNVGSEPETVLKLSPSNHNPRNSEGDFITLKDGRILFIYSHYYGESGSDHAPAYLAGRYSEDGGKSWSASDETVIPNEGDMNVMSVSLLRLKNDKIALFYLRKNSTEDCIPYMRISTDEAESWSDPVKCITDKQGYFVLNNDRVIQLEDGRLLMAVALHKVPGVEWSAKGDLYCYYSDDNGITWRSGDKVPDTTEIITQEPGLIEMKDGRIMMFIRAGGGFQQLSFSSDRGVTWSHIEPGNIPSPVSPATIEKIPGTDDWLMVWNNNDGTDEKIRGNRTPLTIAISEDEGRSWKFIKNIHDDPDGWYCYTAIHFADDGDILLSHCAGSRSSGTGLAVTDITQINKSWLCR